MSDFAQSVHHANRAVRHPRTWYQRRPRLSWPALPWWGVDATLVSLAALILTAGVR